MTQIRIFNRAQYFFQASHLTNKIQEKSFPSRHPQIIYPWETSAEGISGHLRCVRASVRTIQQLYNFCSCKAVTLLHFGMIQCNRAFDDRMVASQRRYCLLVLITRQGLVFVYFARHLRTLLTSFVRNRKKPICPTDPRITLTARG